MSQKRRGLGRGLGALIPQNQEAGGRPVDVFFADKGDEEGGALAHEVEPPVAPAPQKPTPKAAAPKAAPKTASKAKPKSKSAAALPATDNPSVAVSAAPAHDLTPVPGASFAELPLASIRPNPVQPRSVFDEDDMAELVHSIREIGVLQPIVVRAITDGAEGVTHELIMGERRWRASKAAGKTAIPAIIRSTDDDVMLRDALLENLHRSQLNALEEAAAYQQLLDDFGCTQEQLAQRIGRSRPQISNTLRLLKLPPAVARRVAAGVLSAGHARALLTLDDGAAQERLAQRIVAEGLSVRGVEEIVALGLGQEPEGERKRSSVRPGRRNPQLDDMAAALSDHLDTRAKITLGAKKGKITVDFATVDDLYRVLTAMGINPRQ